MAGYLYQVLRFVPGVDAVEMICSRGLTLDSSS